MSRPCGSSRTSERCQSVVESSLVLGLFFVLLLGGIDLGRYVYINTTLSNDARAATRQLVLAANKSTDCTAYQAALFSGGGVQLSVDQASTWGNTASGTTAPTGANQGLVYVYPSVSDVTQGAITQTANCSSLNSRANAWVAGSPHAVLTKIQYRWTPVTPVMGAFISSSIMVAYAQDNAQY